MTPEHILRIRREIRLGIDRDNDEGVVSVPALLTAAGALFAAWFVVTRPLVALAFVVGALCIVGFVTLVGFVGWLIFVWGADRIIDLPPDPDADPIDADRADLPYGGGWGA